MQQLSYFKKFNPKLIVNKLISQILSISYYIIYILLFLFVGIIWALTTKFPTINLIVDAQKIGLNLYALYNSVGVSLLVINIVSMLNVIYQFILAIIYLITYRKFKKQKNIEYEKLKRSNLFYYCFLLIIFCLIFIGYFILFSIAPRDPFYLVCYSFVCFLTSIICLIVDSVYIRKNETIYAYYQNI